jgi:hypothetical protein
VPAVCLFVETGSCYVAGLELAILLPQPPSIGISHSPPQLDLF